MFFSLFLKRPYNQDNKNLWKLLYECAKLNKQCAVICDITVYRKAVNDNFFVYDHPLAAKTDNKKEDVHMKDYATGIQHIGIPTKDMEASKQFYEKLGFEIAYETLNEGNQVKFFKMGNLIMEVYESDDVTMKVGSVDHVAIDVKDIEQTYQEICDLGLNNLQDEIHFLPFWDNGVKFFTIKGPNEEKIEFGKFL